MRYDCADEKMFERMNALFLRSDKEELEWILKAQQGDEFAQQLLITNHRALLLKLANRLRYASDSLDELIQAGNIGFLHAILKYQPSSNVKLTTYAVPWILGEMKRNLRRQRLYASQLVGNEQEPVVLFESIDLRKIDLKIAMERLSENERTLILLRYFRDKTQAETALLLRKSQSQISKIENRALKHLRAYLSE